MLIDKKAAADMIGVPTSWIDAMIELGGLEAHIDHTGQILIDAEEIERKGYTSPKMRAVSLKHVEELLKKLRATA